MLVNCFDILPGILVLGFSIVLVIGLSAAILLLCFTVAGRAHSQRLIDKNVAKYNLKSRFSKFYYCKLKWIAQQPLPSYCGERLALSESSIMNYLGVFFSNSTTAILLYKP